MAVGLPGSRWREGGSGAGWHLSAGCPQGHGRADVSPTGGQDHLAGPLVERPNPPAFIAADAPVLGDQQRRQRPAGWSRSLASVSILLPRALSFGC